MHTVWVRVNAVVFFGLSVLLSLALLTACSTFFHDGRPELTKLALSERNGIKSFRTSQKVDRAMLSFDLKANLAPAFNWNVKQLFVFVTGEYASETNPLNQIILWDKIIQRPEDAALNLKKVNVKYGLIDQKQELRGANVTLKLYWDHMPLTGRLYTESDSQSTFVLPQEYSNVK